MDQGDAPGVHVQKGVMMPSMLVGADFYLHYLLAGQGAPLLLLGGTGWDLRQPLSPFERSLQQHFQVLRYDQRGQGRSSKPDYPYTMADYADDAAHLLDALGISQALPVLGISFGGMVAQEFALRYPQRVTRLILACTSSGGAGGASYPLHTLQDLEPLPYAERFLQLANLKRDAAWQRANAEFYQAMLQFTAHARQELDAEAWRGLQHQLSARKNHDCYHRLPQLRVPVLVCGGEDDGICPPDNLRALAQQIPQAELQLFAGGHGFYLENQQVLPKVLEFLRRW